MMDDYIKRSDAIKTVCGDCEYYATNDCEDCRLDRLTKIPAADVRPVVYCQECIYLGFKDFNGICNGPMCGIVKPWDYCSHGARGGDT